MEGQKLEKFRNLAEQIGFSHVAVLNMNALIPRQEVRQMCSADKCSRFGKTWSCPPACGTLEHTRALIGRYTEGILVQTTEPMEDDFDLEAILRSEKIHKKHFDTLTRQAKMVDRNCLPMAAGSCTRCRKCTYPDHPCRYPDRVFPSMEAYGLWVSDVCEKSGVPYNYGPGTMTYTSCILLREEESL